MYIRLIRNKPNGAAITGRLVIDGRWFCNTLERVGYQILPLCYPVRVTMSPKFKRLLPLVTGVPKSVELCRMVQNGVALSSAEKSTLPNATQPLHHTAPAAEYRTGIRFHRGSKPEHSTGCVLVVADNNDNLNNFRSHQLPRATGGSTIGRSAAEVERALTNLILKAQQEHEEIILEVSDFRPGTELGYNTPCPRELQMP